MTTDARWLRAIEEQARVRLPGPIFEYVSQGAGDGLSVAEARSQWQELRFRPHVMRDVTEVDLGAELLGQRHEVPWGIAPTTLQRAINRDGEVAMARATAEAGGLMVVSSNAGTTFADIAATGVSWWLQLYVPSDRTLAVPLLERAVAAGASAIVLTVDTPVVSAKRVSDADGRSAWDLVDPATVRINFDDGYDQAAGAAKARDLGPHDIDWVSTQTGLPVVVKGVLRGDDANRCVQAGARAVWVSNHGGRQLDRAQCTVDALREIVAAVPEAEVYVDGGVRDGLDVLTAAALGARGVFLGRLPLYALVEGEAGVRRMHAELRRQLEESLRLSGCRTLADAPGILVREPENRP